MWIGAGIAVAVIGLIADIVGLWPYAKGWIDQHHLLGWGLAICALIALAGTISEARQRGRRLRSRHQTDIDAMRREERKSAAATYVTRDKQNRADHTLVTEILGGLSPGGALRDELRDHIDKYFKSGVARDFEAIDRRWTEMVEVIHDDDLRQRLGSAKKAFDAYWHILDKHLDAPPELDGRELDLRVITPPGGPWGSDVEKYYVFVRSLAGLREHLMDELRQVDARLYDLQVEIGK